MGLLPNPSPVEPPQYPEMVQYPQQFMVFPCQPEQQPTMTMMLQWVDNKGFLVPAGMPCPIMVPADAKSFAQGPILCHGAVLSPMLDAAAGPHLQAAVTPSPMLLCAGPQTAVEAPPTPAEAATVLTTQVEETVTRPVTPAKKHLWKLQKKLREIEKIEAKKNAGDKVDKLQLAKLDSKPSIQHDIEEALRVVQDEETEKEDYRQEIPADVAPACASAWAVQGSDGQLQWPPQDLGTHEPQPQLQWQPQSAGMCQGENAVEDQPRVLLAHWQGYEDHHLTGPPPQQQQRAFPLQWQGAQHNMGLMDDASYVKLTEQIENSTDKETQDAALNKLRGHIFVASRHREGCRAVQAAFAVARKPLRLDLTRELHGHVCELIQSPSGNYVIQKVIEVLPTNEYRFVLSELAGNVKGLAQHRFGCRIFCRLLEHSEGTPSQELDLLLDELLVDVVEACKTPFAHYAVDAVLGHGSHVQRRKIGEALKGNLWKLAKNKHASHIIEKAFGMGEEHCPIDIQLELVQELIFEGPQALEVLATNRYGAHVMIALAKFVRTQLLDEQCVRILTQLAQSPTLARTNAGQRFLEAMFGTCKTSDNGQSFSG